MSILDCLEYVRRANVSQFAHLGEEQAYLQYHDPVPLGKADDF
jgi:hypothetical protein